MKVQEKEVDPMRIAGALVAAGEITAIVHAFTPQEFQAAMKQPGLIPEYRAWVEAVFVLASSIHNRHGRFCDE